MIEKDLRILAYLRQNAREKVTSIARKTEIPVTTIYDRIRIHHKRFVKKNTVIVDFEKMGFAPKLHIVMKVAKSEVFNLQDYLMANLHVNSLYKLNHDQNFLAECIFKDDEERERFLKDLSRFGVQISMFHEIQELKKEYFLSKPEHLTML